MDIPDGPQLESVAQERERRRQGVTIQRVRRPSKFPGFLNGNKTAIRSSALATALVSILQLADGHPDGIIAALGHGNRTRWINDTFKSFFQSDGCLSDHKVPSKRVFTSHFKDAETLARSHYDRDHSNDATGASHESVPLWTRLFFRYFDAQTSQRSTNSQTLASRSRMTSVVRSIVGAQAPLGHDGNSTASLRNETSTNHASNFRQQVIGGVEVGLLRTNTQDDLSEEDGITTNQDDPTDDAEAPNESGTGSSRGEEGSGDTFIRNTPKSSKNPKIRKVL